MLSSSARKVTLALVFVSTAACSSSGGGGAADSAPVSTPRPTSMAEIHLPLEAYILDYEHKGKLEVLQYRLRDACVKAKGFTPPPMSVAGAQAAASYVKLWRYYDTRRYAISDMATAREYGYEMPPFTNGTAKPIGLGTLSKPLRDTMIKCNEETDKKTHEGLPADPNPGTVGDLATDLRAKGFQEAQSDPRVVDVFKKWSACMAQKGYHYATPIDANKAAGPMDSSRPKPEEINTAVAEVECVYETNMLGVSSAVEAEYENKDIEKNAEALNKLKARNEQVAKKIDELWAQSG